VALVDARMAELLGQISAGPGDMEAMREAWASVIGLIDQRRKLVESERKRLVELQQRRWLGRKPARVLHAHFMWSSRRAAPRNVRQQA